MNGICLGGSNGDRGFAIQQTSDGNFILAGYAESDNGNVTGNHGGDDYWIVKLNSEGSIIWQKSLGGSEKDEANSIQQTSDGGYIVAGFSDSDDGDAPGNYGGNDYWIVKLDGLGNLLWQKRFGGMNTDEAYSISQTTDGGYVIAGYSNSNSGDVSGNHGGFDYWVVKLDADGNLMWQKSLGGSDNDDAYSILQTTDGGFIIAGTSFSGDHDVSYNHGEQDYWIVKLNGSGDLEWQKSLGGSDIDIAYLIRQTTDGGFIVAGNSYSNDGDVIGNHGVYWIVKLDATGNITWQKSLDGACTQGDIQQTNDNGFIVVGQGDGNFNGITDYFIARLDVNGDSIWQEFFGGHNYDVAHSVQQTSDGGFIVLGETNSNGGDVSGHIGSHDYWVVKLSGDQTGIPSLPANSFSISPNPVQSQLTINLAMPNSEAVIRVYDVEGRIRQTALSGQTDKVVLSTEKLPAGFYTLQIINNKTGESEAGKFVKEE